MIFSKDKTYGFHFPSLFGYSTFGWDFIWYNAWPDSKRGTNYWSFFLYLGPPKWGTMLEWKIDFWRPKDLNGWEITVYLNGESATHVGGKGRIVYLNQYMDMDR